MDISLQNIGKRYGRQWIFRNINIEIPENSCLAITGRNGSGKSTLLKIISGYNTPSEGQVVYRDGEKTIQSENTSTSFNLAAPYQNLIEELTLIEHLKFHFSFKEPTLSLEEVIQRSGLNNAKNKLIQEFSSGMKQRLKLSLAFFSKADCIFLDEPTANLDEQGIDWYKEEISSLLQKNTIIIASNLSHEYVFAETRLDISDFISH